MTLLWNAIYLSYYFILKHFKNLVTTQEKKIEVVSDRILKLKINTATAAAWVDFYFY